VLVDQLGGEAEYLVFGVATEYCVRCAAKGLLDRGRKVALLGDAIAALDALAGRRTLDELQNLGARLTTTDEALAELGARTSSKTSRTAAAHPSQNK
jgi:nicotinamidase/pyrazinamidase